MLRVWLSLAEKLLVEVSGNTSTDSGHTAWAIDLHHLRWPLGVNSGRIQILSVVTKLGQVIIVNIICKSPKSPNLLFLVL